MTAAEREREALLDEAVRAGKFSADRKPLYRAKYDKDPAGTRQLVAKLAAVLPDMTVVLPDTDTDAYPSRWLSASERRRIATTTAEHAARPERPPQRAPGPSTPSSGSALAESSYPAEWLSAAERARIMMAGKGDPPPTISLADDR